MPALRRFLIPAALFLLGYATFHFVKCDGRAAAAEPSGGRTHSVDTPR